MLSKVRVIHRSPSTRHSMQAPRFVFITSSLLPPPPPGPFFPLLFPSLTSSLHPPQMVGPVPRPGHRYALVSERGVLRRRGVILEYESARMEGAGGGGGAYSRRPLELGRG